MKKFQESLEKYVLPIASKIQNNAYVSSVSDGFTLVLPIILMGAIFTLLSSLQIAPYQSFVTATGLKSILGFASSVTSDLLALYVVYGISYQLTKKLGYNSDVAFVAPMAIVMFFILIPMGAQGTAEVSKELVTIKGVISTEFLGTKGLFTAILVGLVVPSIYTWFIKHKIIIKMPSSVPPTVSKSFSSLIPGFAILLVFSLLRFGFSMTQYGNFNTFLYSIIGKPLSVLGNSPLSFLAFVLVAHLLWFLGIHGYMVIRPFLQVIYLPLAVENLAAYSAGQPLPNAITFYHYGTYVNLGGSGGLLGLTILMAFVAKSQRYKSLGKLGLPSTICSINEPIIFGAPIVLNPIFIIPFILTPIISFSLAYILQMLNIIPYLRGVVLPLGTPALAYGWLQGGLPLMLFQVVLISIQMAIYYPFFLISDRQSLKEEAETIE